MHNMRLSHECFTPLVICLFPPDEGTAEVLPCEGEGLDTTAANGYWKVFEVLLIRKVWEQKIQVADFH